jgi:Chromo (CHRromatin Organisation MOdifier) domain
MNQSTEQYLRMFINYRQDDWKEWLSLAEFAYNDSVHAATKQTPFFLNYGQHPWKGDDVKREVRNEAAGAFAERMKWVWEDAQAALWQAAGCMKESHHKHARPSIEYKVGDKVYLETTNLKMNRPSKKLNNKWFGPFKIIKKVKASSYELELPPTWPAVHLVYNESYLSSYKLPRFPNQLLPPPPPAILLNEGQTPEYKVEEIRDMRKRRKKVQYPREEDTWEPVANLSHTQDLIDDFHRQNPKKKINAIVKVHDILLVESIYHTNEMIALRTLVLNDFEDDDLLLQAVAGFPSNQETEMSTLEKPANDDLPLSEDELNFNDDTITIWALERDDSPSDDFPSW